MPKKTHKRTATTRRKTTKKVAKRTTRKPARKQSVLTIESTYSWEILPFVVAVIVAIVVVTQSMESAEKYTGTRSVGRYDTKLHMAAGDCVKDGAALRKEHAAERGWDRAVQLLQDAEDQYNWECTMDVHSTSCRRAQEIMRLSENLVEQKLRDVKRLKLESCL